MERRARGGRAFGVVRSRARLMCGLITLCALAMPVRASAKRIQTVSVARDDDVPLDPELVETLHELLARIRVRLARAAPVTVTLTPAGDGMDVRVRRSEHDDVTHHVDAVPSAELFRETLAHVIVGAVEPLLDVPEPPPPPRESGVLRLGLESGPSWVERRTLAARTGASAVYLLPSRPRVGLGVSAAFTPRLRLEAREVEASAYLTSMRARPSLEALRRDRFTLEVALPLGADVALLRTREVPMRAEARARSVRVDPVLGASLTGRLHLSARWSLALSVGVDVTPTPRRWLVRDFTGAQVRLFALERARPYGALAVEWTLARAAPTKAQAAP